MELSQLKDNLEKELYKLFSQSKSLTLFGPLKFDKNSLHEHKTEGVIFVDGGLGHSGSLNNLFCNVPSYSTGDGDSLQTKVELDLTFPADKDQSDLSLVLSAIPSMCQNLELFGFFGERQDHFLCNLGEINHFLNISKSDKQVRLHGDKQTIFAINNNSITLKIIGTFSILSLVENILDIKGDCEYTCNEHYIEYPLSSLGLSNKGYGDVIIRSKKPIFIITEYE
ncbi:MAG: hypothetical protein HN576_03805 [Bacteriovoracaceae bacterium]|jgi:thiamine pyrophosphokinase|nr:hypothetical protein [Bacteriovoracaceae bacterium]